MEEKGTNKKADRRREAQRLTRTMTCSAAAARVSVSTPSPMVGAFEKGGECAGTRGVPTPKTDAGAGEHERYVGVG